MNKISLMKYAFLSLLLVISFSFKSQSQTVFADPYVAGFDVTNVSFVSQNANMLFKDNHYLLRLATGNSNQNNAIPAGTAILKIGLGSKAKPDYPDPYNPAVNFSQYFTWTATDPTTLDIDGNPQGQWEVVGRITAPGGLPADFNGTIDIKMTPTVVGSSTFTANFLTANEGGSFTLSDENPNNNGATLSYTVFPNVPVKFSGIDVTKTGCSVKVNFTTENEINVDHYEIEASKDGINFVKVGQSAVTAQHLYKADFALTSQLQANKIFVRVKSVDHDGRILYSDQKAVSGICDKALQMSIYPNPVQAGKTAVINATEGLFNGKYKVSVHDFAGKQLQLKELDLANASRFEMEVANLAAGKYIIRVTNTDGTESAVLQMQKL